MNLILRIYPAAILFINNLFDTRFDYGDLQSRMIRYSL